MTYFHEDFPDYNPLDLEYIPLRSDDKSGKKIMKQKSKKKHESMAAFRSKVSGLDLLGGGGGDKLALLGSGAALDFLHEKHLSQKQIRRRKRKLRNKRRHKSKSKKLTLTGSGPECRVSEWTEWSSCRSARVCLTLI